MVEWKIDFRYPMSMYRIPEYRRMLFQFSYHREFALARPKIGNYWVNRWNRCLKLEGHGDMFWNFRRAQVWKGVDGHPTWIACDKLKDLYVSTAIYQDGIPDLISRQGNKLTENDNGDMQWARNIVGSEQYIAYEDFKANYWKMMSGNDLLLAEIDAPDDPSQNEMRIVFEHPVKETMKLLDKYSITYNIHMTGQGFHITAPSSVTPDGLTYSPFEWNNMYAYNREIVMLIKKVVGELVDKMPDRRQVLKLPYSLVHYPGRTLVVHEFDDDDMKKKFSYSDFFIENYKFDFSRKPFYFNEGCEKELGIEKLRKDLEVKYHVKETWEKRESTWKKEKMLTES